MIESVIETPTFYAFNVKAMSVSVSGSFMPQEGVIFFSKIEWVPVFNTLSDRDSF